MSQDVEAPNASPVDGDDTVDKTEHSKSTVSPGEMLRHARETLNLTIGDLAGQTRLSRAVLEALEKNDFGNLAMPVYVRGYYRKCAHVMNMPEDKLLQAYADWTGTSLTPQPLPVTVSEPPREYASPSRTPSWRYVIIIAVVIGAAMWWFGSGGEMKSPVATSENSPVTTLEIDPPAISEPLPLTLGEDTATNSPEIVEGQPIILPPAQPLMMPAETEVAPTEATTPVATTAAPTGGPRTLQIKVSQTSWVEVKDDDNRQLVYGLLTPGTEQSVNGKPPYSVVLGRPQGVELQIGGQLIDLAPHTSGSGTARLEVEAQ